MHRACQAELSILHWRCGVSIIDSVAYVAPLSFQYSIGDAASSSTLSTSLRVATFNTPLEMLGDKDMSEYQLSQRLTFQYSIGDAFWHAGHGLRAHPSAFNTPLEMPGGVKPRGFSGSSMPFNTPLEMLPRIFQRHGLETAAFNTPLEMLAAALGAVRQASCAPLSILHWRCEMLQLPQPFS